MTTDRQTDKQTNKQTNRTKTICPRSFDPGHRNTVLFIFYGIGAKTIKKTFKVNEYWNVHCKKKIENYLKPPFRLGQLIYVSSWENILWKFQVFFLTVFVENLKKNIWYLNYVRRRVGNSVSDLYRTKIRRGEFRFVYSIWDSLKGDGVNRSYKALNFKAGPLL